MKIAEYTTPTDATKKAQPPIEEESGSLLRHLWASVAATVILVIICCGVYPVVVWGIAQTAFPVQANGSLVKKDGTYTTNDQEAVGSALLGQNFSAPQYFRPRPSQNSYDAANSGGSNLGPISDKLLNGIAAAPPAPDAAPATAAASSPATTAAANATSMPATAPVVAAPPAPAFDGVRLRAIHFAVDNGITFKLYNVKYAADGTIASKTEVPLTKFQDKDGNLLDNALVDAFPHVGDPEDKTPLIAADFATPIPADAVTASGSGLDPHISPENAALQAQRVADTRKLSKDKVMELIAQNTDRPSFGILGDAGVNVLMLNIALDKLAPMPASLSTTAASPTNATIPATSAK